MGKVASPHPTSPGGAQMHGVFGKMFVRPHVPPPPQVPLQYGLFTDSHGWLPSGMVEVLVLEVVDVLVLDVLEVLLVVGGAQ